MRQQLSGSLSHILCFTIRTSLRDNRMSTHIEYSYHASSNTFSNITESKTKIKKNI